MDELRTCSDSELREVQRIEREALALLLDLCRRLDISCFLMDGAAIGAVRHRGFIPWDDDLDVGMLRADYRRFLAEAPALLPPGYTLQTPYNDPKSPYFYSKLRVDGTVFMEYANRKLTTAEDLEIVSCLLENRRGGVRGGFRGHAGSGKAAFPHAAAGRTDGIVPTDVLPVLLQGRRSGRAGAGTDPHL